MKQLIRLMLFSVALAVISYGQSDWDKYPERSIAEIVKTHSGGASNKADLIVSADPFPSKTVLIYTGKHRPIGEFGKSFIGIWAESRKLPPEKTGLLVEEYLFKEQGKEYWLPVHKMLAPNFAKELKEGEEITVYYFFLGGYNEKKLRDKSKDKPKQVAAGRVEDRVQWVFAVEEFQKIQPSAQPESDGYINQPLAAAIDRSLERPGKKPENLIDTRQVKSKSRVTYTGETRNVGEMKIRFLELWLQHRGLPPQVIDLLRQEARFHEGDKDYWLPVRKKILDDMAAQLKKGDPVVVHTILAGGVPQGDSLEWVFVVGEFSK